MQALTSSKSAVIKWKTNRQLWRLFLHRVPVCVWSCWGRGRGSAKEIEKVSIGQVLVCVKTCFKGAWIVYEGSLLDCYVHRGKQTNRLIYICAQCHSRPSMQLLLPAFISWYTHRARLWWLWILSPGRKSFLLGGSLLGSKRGGWHWMEATPGVVI